jgi:hypothetical protein
VAARGRPVCLGLGANERGPQDNVEQAETDESWIDPLVGAHYTLPINDALADLAAGRHSLRVSLHGHGLRRRLRSRSLRIRHAFSGPALGLVFTS